MKRILSVVIVLTMLFSLAVPAFAESYEELPTIYVMGAHKNDIYNAKGETIYPLQADIGATIKEALEPCLKELAKGFITNDFTDYANEFNNAMAPIYEELILDKNGDVSNGSYTRFQSSVDNCRGKTSGYETFDCRLWYDWRESPMKTAAELRDYIDDVLESTGKSKVQIVGRCYGANVIAAYLEMYKDHAKANVADVSYYSSSVLGIDFMSALFSGEIYLDDVAIENLLDYYVEKEEIIEDVTAATLVTSLVEVIRQAKLLGLAGQALVNFVNNFKTDLLPLIIRDSYGGWLSYWAMITPELYEKSRDFIFNTDELKTEYKGLIEKADSFHYTVQLNAVKTMTELSEAGINFYIFAKYNFPEMPFYEGARAQGDADTTVFRQSFGGIASDYGKVLSESYLNSVPESSKKYISPDKKIDASTCLFPDTTWFVKDLHHDFFSPLHKMSFEIMRYDWTVENEKYPQYLTHTGKGDNIVDELIPTVGTDEDYQKEEKSFFRNLIDFFSSLVKYLISLIKSKI